MSRRLLLLALAWGASVAQLNSEDSFKMPEGFLFGGGSASYQTEGGWNAAGKGVSVFDHYFHQAFPNKTSADVTCDFFHRYKEDLKIAADLKFNVFRFSISWTRLFPRGNISEVNQAGVQFYHDLINEIVAHKMRPLCTIYHFDHPQAYEDEFSGWQSEKMIEKYLEYAKFVLREFGDKVDFWTSINEPNMYCSLVYNGIIPPGMPGQLDSQKVYKCIHNEIIAHAKAFRYYKEEYPKITGRTTGMFGITATSMMARPQTTGFDDIYAAYKTNMFDTSMVLHPVVFGEYPPVVRATLEAQGRGNELPTFTAEEQKIVKGSIDYIGLNAFTGRMVAASAAEGHPSDPLLASLVGPLSDHGAADVSGSSLVTPWILRDITLWIKEIYGVKVFITENGLSTPGKKVDDWNMRAVYHSMYLRELFRTINVDGANVFGYTVWSFLDGYEFANAFESEDGLIYIDHDDPTLQRTPKKSAEYLKNVAEQRYAAPLSASAAHQYDAYTLLTALVTYWLCRVTAPLLS